MMSRLMALPWSLLLLAAGLRPLEPGQTPGQVVRPLPRVGLADEASTPTLPGSDFLRIFPLASYHELGRPWLESREDRPLVKPEFQAEKALAFRNQVLSAWDPVALSASLPAGVPDDEARTLANLRQDVAHQRGFGPNYRPYQRPWLDQLAARVPPALPRGFKFREAQRAVLLEHALVRVLPTTDFYFESHTIPGQGYPFDQFQSTVAWAGTPVYILQETRDGAWSRILTADSRGWVRSQALARVDPAFVAAWRQAVDQRGLTAVVRTEAPVTDAHGVFRFQAYVGEVFPAGDAPAPRPGILIPGRDPATGMAMIQRAFLPEGDGVPQPWVFTPDHAARLMKTLLGRPYGWGNLRLDNDCSAEMKAFFTPFGLWLPRHSADQKQAGRSLDLSCLGLAERLEVLRGLGHPYLTLIWIQGHVMLYLGPVTYPAAGGPPATGFMTYQNLWSLRPKDPPDARSVVGGSVLFPVLDRYPEAPDLDSLANKPRFVLTHLDEP